MTAACIALASGWAITIIGAALFSLAIEADRARLGLLAALLVAAGLVSCAVEDRVCELAEREGAP